MIEVAIPQWVISVASRKAKELGTLKNSITEGEGNLAGYVGEIMVSQQINCILWDTYDWDILSAKGSTIDVKTKRSTSAPKNHYMCSVAAFNIKQECDVYVFVRLNLETKLCWILGWMWKSDFFRDATLFHVGDYDQSNDWTCSADCYSIRVDGLKSFNVDLLDKGGHNVPTQ